MKAKLLFSVLFFLSVTMIANAQNRSTDQTNQAVTPVNRGVYVDANNNGICDTYETYGAYRGGRGIAVGRGYGRGYGAGQGLGRGYGGGRGRALAAGQGRGLGPAKGWGRGLGPGQGKGLAPGGRYYTDENKNGVCDTYEKSVK